MFTRFLSKFKLAYEDPLQEKEYSKLRFPLTKEVFKYLCGCLTIFFIPLTFRYYVKNLFPQTYIGIGALTVSIIIFIMKSKLLRFMKLLSIAYISFILGMAIWNINRLLTLPGNIEAFYMGYTYALMQKMIDFRAMKYWITLTFNIFFNILTFILIKISNPEQIILIICLEVFPIILSFKCEQADRSLFDSLFKSKNQLLKFKQLITEYLPNQIAIFAEDFSKTYFVNDSFKKLFNTVDMTQTESSLNRFVLDSQDYEKNKELLTFIKDENKQDHDNMKLTLMKFLKQLTNKKELIKKLGVISFQLIEQNLDLKQESVNKKPDLLKEKQKNLVHEKPSINRELPDDPLVRKDPSNKNDNYNFQQITIPTELKNSSDGLDDRDCFIRREEKSERDQELKRRVFKAKIFSLTWDDQEAIAMVLDDVTHERTIMELKIAAKNKDLVIATVSHELRTPLNGTLGLLEIMKKTVNQPEVMSYLTACKSNCRLLLNLVNSILDLSQIENKKLRLVYSKVSLADLLAEIKTLFDHYCEMKNLYLNIDVHKNVRQTLITDHIRLSQILINLLGNAFKFTFKGGITLKLSVESDNPYRLKFTVKDTGIGIKKENQEKLFKLFGRLEQQDKNINTQGVGLGLTISNTLAMLLNPVEKRGIQVDSELGKGSEFSFVVQSFDKIETDPEIGPNSCEINEEHYPLISVLERMSSYIDMKEIKGSGSSVANSQLDSRSLLNLAISRNTKIPGRLASTTLTNIERVSKNLVSEKCNTTKAKDCMNNNWQSMQNESLSCLIVDDNPFNLMVAINLLKERGYKVQTALNGQEAINKVEEHTKEGRVFDYILMDCQMPVMDGYEATRILKRMMREGSVSESPIIALTANNQNEEHEKLCIDAGMNGCIAKPLRVKDLEYLLQKLELKRSQ